MTQRLLVLGIVTALAGSAAADVRTTTFKGWSKNGTYWGDTTFLCASTSGDAVIWNLPKPTANESDIACTDETGAEVDKARADLVLPPALKTLPAGLKVKISQSEEGALYETFNVTAKGKKVVCEVDGDSGSPFKTLSYWIRADGNALAVLFQQDADNGLFQLIGQCDISKLHLGPQGGGAAPAAPAAPAGDRKGATEANAKGMKAYKAHQWADALEAFSHAEDLDPSFVAARYDYASVLALIGDIKNTRRELAWMSKSSDKEAARLLAKAKSDPDLDAASTDPEVRKLIGAPSWSELSAEARLLERSGVWSAEGAECGAPTVSFKFKKGGTFAGTAVVDCKGKKQSQPVKGTWTAAGDAFALKTQVKGKSVDGSVKPAKCTGSAVEGSCLSVAGESVLMHRGVPEVQQFIY